MIPQLRRSSSTPRRDRAGDEAGGQMKSSPPIGFGKAEVEKALEAAGLSE